MPEPTQHPMPVITLERTAPEAQDRCLFATAKAVDADARTVEVVASTIQIDRDGEIILPSAFAETLPKFLASNAPLLAAHTHRSESGQPMQIGWVMDGRIERTRVVLTVRFAQTEPAEAWWLLASDPGGKGIATSIGFRPRRYVTGTAADLREQFPEIRGPLKEGGVPDDCRMVVYTEIELLELSCVPVPSNRQALQLLAAKAFGLAVDDDPDGAKTLDALAAEIAKRLQPAAIDVPETGPVPNATDVLNELKSLRDELAEMKELILSLAPDHWNPALPPDGPGDEERGTGAGGADDGADDLERACADFRQTLAKP